MKKFLIFFLFLASSCVGMSCIPPSEYDKNRAQSYYDSFSATLVDVKTHERIRKKFACEYRPGDDIYAYKTFLDTKYILVRYRQAISYIEEWWIRISEIFV